jgi:predicted 2-oxoglutarate/Fe(II)-dependent dioxygenase YbiX
MPQHKIFRDLGLFLIPGFISEPECRELIDIMSGAPKRPGQANIGSGKSHVDETWRSVGDAKVPEDANARVLRTVLDLHPALEKHFRIPLEWGGEGPDYLVYQTGDFFKPHVDNYEDRPGPNSRVLRRRVAIVLFLNRHSREQREDCFGGGLLNFYGLLEGPQWKSCPLGLEAEPGLLVAFPSGLMHEVTPVTFGVRYSVLTGFHAPSASAQSPSESATQ